MVVNHVISTTEVGGAHSLGTLMLMLGAIGVVPGAMMAIGGAAVPERPDNTPGATTQWVLPRTQAPGAALP